MKGKDFFNLAVSLSAGSTPAEMRTSISRAYYGAFHAARELLETWGITLPRGPECHVKLRQLLDTANDPVLTVANSELSSLRSARNSADYELATDRAATKTVVLLHLRTADKVISSLEAFSGANPDSAVADVTRRYARDVLKLIVRT